MRTLHERSVCCGLIAGVLGIFVMNAVGAAEPTEKEPIVFNPDTGWCWFQDERAIIDNGQLLLSGVSSRGDITVTSHHLTTGKTSVCVLHARLQADDHDAPALLVLPDGRYLATYSKHGNDRFMLWRISTRPGDASEWQPEARFDHGSVTTYSNLYRMSAEGPDGRLYNFTRAFNWDPNFVLSDDHGASWRHGGRLLNGKSPYVRPYVRYTGNGKDTVHFITTEDHPNRAVTSIYHGFVRDGKSHRSDGTIVDETIFGAEAPTAKAFTRVFRGDKNNVAWTSDIELDERGNPVIAYSVMKDSLPRKSGKRGCDHRYHWANWDGKKWHTHEIAYAGSRLYPGEPEYTGLISLHPRNPSVVFISADVDPVSGEPILVNGKRRYEIFKGTTENAGESWRWTPITKASSQDNLRPIIVADDNVAVLVWLRGEYRTFTNYNQAAVGLIWR